MEIEFEINESMKDWAEKAKAVFDRLQDDESRVLFNLKNRLMTDLIDDNEAWVDEMSKLYSDWNPQGFLNDYKDNIVIYGSGHDGRIIANILRNAGITPKCFCETPKPFKEKIDGISVECIDDIIEDYKNAYIIASEKYRHEIYAYLLNRKISTNHIYIPSYRYPMISRGNQYFDVFEPDDEEVFLDAGAYDGDTLGRFYNWAGKNAKSAYAIELLPEMCDKIAGMGKNRDITVINGAAWSVEETLYFSDLGTASRIADTGMTAVAGIPIDCIEYNKIPTFIKMDIEGAEYNALQGARNTIRKYKPKLAICVYHKPNDVVELGKYILELVPEYKLWIRHYTTLIYETVMYASL
ncbi:FkbM family methyltransferase [Butyrivibrio fibrisolvens]|uniref:FkbM family methyltransferase n=1 Tax=Butyrivibrio fibrisolvens TaxID=831 RepID=UPI0003B6D7FF|nr:FkbM family methyltransferase [Butyrivibrio fibrisolvens]